MQRLEPEQIENQTFPVSRRGYDPEKVDGFLQVVAAYYREALRQADARVTSAPPAPAPEKPSAPERPFEQLGDQVAAVLSTAARAAEDLTRNAEREVQQMKKAAAAEAAETTQAVNAQLAAARQTKAESEQEAETILAEAQDEATRVRQEAHTVAARLEENARERAGKVEKAANAKIASILAEARRRFDELRRVTYQSASQLESVESVLRKAREALLADHPKIEAVAEVAVEEAGPHGELVEAATDAQKPPNGAPEPDAPTSEMIADVLEPRLTKRKKPPGARPPGTRTSGPGKSSGQNSVKQ